MTLKVTDGGSRRIRAAVSKAGEGSWYTFDYSTQEAVILKPSSLTTLGAWLDRLAQSQRIAKAEGKSTMALAILVLLFLSLNPFTTKAQQAQEPKHAPLAAQCQADVRVWYSDQMFIDYNEAQAEWHRHSIPNHKTPSEVGVRELRARQNEMGQCMSVDPQNESLYLEAFRFYFGVFTDRVVEFMDRHGLRKQMEREDAAGLR